MRCTLGQLRPPSIIRVLAWSVLTGLFLVVVPTANGEVVYQSSFDSLALGQTQTLSVAGQDGWFRLLAPPGGAFGEIQDTIANGGRALHEHTTIDVSPHTQTIDARNLNAYSLANAGVISLSIDFYASTSDQNAVNPYAASFLVRGGPHPGFDIIGFDLLAGNGVSKSPGVSVALAGFNGAANNEPLPLLVGQNLAWDEWHSLSLSLDHSADTWLSITVDGVTQDLTGFRPPRSEDSGIWKRGQLIENLFAQVVPQEFGGVRTDDDIYFDNLTLRVQPVPEPGALTLAAFAISGAATLTLHRRARSWTGSGGGRSLRK